MHRILLLDDERSILSALNRMLRTSDLCHEGRRFELTIDVFTDPHDALARIEQDVRYEVLLSDYRMPSMDGVTFLSRAREFQPDAVRMVLSGYADMQALIGAINEAEIYRFVTKPWQDDDLRRVIAAALVHYENTVENRLLADRERLKMGRLTKQEYALRELEAQMPGITRVKWGGDGSVIFDNEAGGGEQH